MGRVGTTTRTRDRRIDHDQLAQPTRMTDCRTDTDPRSHGVADNGVSAQPQRFGKCDHIISLRFQAVVQLAGSRRQTTSSHVEYVGIEVTTKTLTYKAPGHRRASDARNNDHGIAIGVSALDAAIPKIVLPDAIGAQVSAVKKRACHDEPRCV
ncbi:hypothetical protein D3C73_1319130 [compost metagenome]